MKTKSQIGKLARRKGHQFERDIVNKLKPLFPRARRRLEYQSDVAEDGVDIDNTGCFNFQLKRLKKYASVNAIKEINRPSGIDVLVTKGDSEREVAVMYLDDLIVMMKDFIEVKVIKN
jgi:hypothetical protein